jgi:glutamate 5-kinase
VQLKYQKITVKIGSNVLAKANGKLNVALIAHLVDQIALLHKKGVEVILVSSGAVAAGRAVLEPLRKTDAVSKRQLWAALGQVKLISRYSDFFNEHGLICAQVLTTKENFSSRGHYLNMKNCMNTLLENRVIPIVNENDTISVTELMFTDNDELSGLIASMVNSEALIILSNVDGVFTAHPENANAQLIRKVGYQRQENLKMLFRESFRVRSWGNAYKVQDCQKTGQRWDQVHLANGYERKYSCRTFSTGKMSGHTWFEPSAKPSSGVKKWIAYSDGFTKGKVVINKGAAAALRSEKAVSLLPVGVIESIENEFKKGDLIRDR